MKLRWIFFSCLCVVAARAESRPIVAVVPELQRLQKWNDSNGDTADPFWADDDQLYHFTCDGRGFGKVQRNLCFNKLMGPDLLHLKGELVSAMDEYGKAGAKAADGSNWKVCGQECIDGVFYAFVACNQYGKDSKDPLMRQTSYNGSLIKSTDRGRTWTRSAKENYAQPMWPGGRFGGPSFIHYGKNGGQVALDQADQFAYAISNNGFWNGGDDFILGRCRRADLAKLNAGDWSYYAGGDGHAATAWTSDITKAQPVLVASAKLGWTAPVFVPALNRYLLVSWYVTPTLKKWFEPGVVTYEFFEAEHPWGPWSFLPGFSDRFLASGHMYGPNLCAKFQERRGDDVQVDLYTSGCPFQDKPEGLYKMWRIPLTLKTKPLPPATLVNDDDPAIRYTGNWIVSRKRKFHNHQDDVHASQSAGDAAEFTFTGTGVEWLAEKFSDQGSAEVFLDGQSRGTVQLKQQDFPRLVQVRVFSAQQLPAGRHTLKIVNTGSDFVAIDAFAITK
ncbi:MAG: hypothetical protein NTY53_16805 [Kiritimatiellaeota bacterium]|nr:hypothetical protein [Kiritimatiellota bacterium]